MVGFGSDVPEPPRELTALISCWFANGLSVIIIYLSAQEHPTASLGLV